MSEIKAGDLVTVKDWGEAFSTCTSWFIKHNQNLHIEWLINYKYGDNRKFINCRCADKTVYRVLYRDYNQILICENTQYAPDETGVYLIGINGVEEYIKPKQMTQKEIEDILGYPIELVKEHTEENN